MSDEIPVIPDVIQSAVADIPLAGSEDTHYESLTDALAASVTPEEIAEFNGVVAAGSVPPPAVTAQDASPVAPSPAPSIDPNVAAMAQANALLQQQMAMMASAQTETQRALAELTGALKPPAKPEPKPEFKTIEEFEAYMDQKASKREQALLERLQKQESFLQEAQQEMTRRKAVADLHVEVDQAIAPLLQQFDNTDPAEARENARALKEYVANTAMVYGLVNDVGQAAAIAKKNLDKLLDGRIKGMNARAKAAVAQRPAINQRQMPTLQPAVGLGSQPISPADAASIRAMGYDSVIDALHDPNFKGFPGR